MIENIRALNDLLVAVDLPSGITLAVILGFLVLLTVAAKL